MTLTLIVLLLSPIAAYIVANLEANDDFQEIERRKKAGDKSDLNHRWLMFVRLVMLAIGLAASSIVYLHEGTPWWMGLLQAGTAWGVFVMRHRWKLNGLRGLHACYMAPGNNYDWLFIRTQGYHWREADIAEHDRKYNGVGDMRLLQSQYQYSIHRAARLAYWTEATISLACLVWAVGIVVVNLSNA